MSHREIQVGRRRYRRNTKKKKQSLKEAATRKYTKGRWNPNVRVSGLVFAFCFGANRKR
jgi:hypothetical protein